MAWNTDLNAFLESIGWVRCVTDTCIYVKQCNRSIHVEGYSLTTRSRVTILKTRMNVDKKKFMDKYKTTDMGECKRMNVTRDRAARTLYLDLEGYSDQLTNMECKTVLGSAHQQKHDRVRRRNNWTRKKNKTTHHCQPTKHHGIDPW